MYVSFQGKLQQPINTQPKYSLLQLVNNNIGAEGCLYLAQANWKQLNKVALSISRATQCATVLETKDVVIWQRLNGVICEHQTSVLIDAYQKTTILKQGDVRTCCLRLFKSYNHSAQVFWILVRQQQYRRLRMQISLTREVVQPLNS